MLKIGKYHVKFPGEYIYRRGQEKHAVFFILEGVVSIMNDLLEFKKLLFTGETLGEEMLFSSQPDRHYLESAKIITQAFLLEISVKDYLTLKKELRKYGNSKTF